MKRNAEYLEEVQKKQRKYRLLNEQIDDYIISIKFSAAEKESLEDLAETVKSLVSCTKEAETAHEVTFSLITSHSLVLKRMSYVPSFKYANVGNFSIIDIGIAFFCPDMRESRRTGKKLYNRLRISAFRYEMV